MQSNLTPLWKPKACPLGKLNINKTRKPKIVNRSYLEMMITDNLDGSTFRGPKRRMNGNLDSYVTNRTNGFLTMKMTNNKPKRCYIDLDQE